MICTGTEDEPVLSPGSRARTETCRSTVTTRLLLGSTNESPCVRWDGSGKVKRTRK